MNGEPLEIGFTAPYLLELLRYMPTDEYRKWVAQSAVDQRDLLTRYGFAKKRP